MYFNLLKLLDNGDEFLKNNTTSGPREMSHRRDRPPDWRSLYELAIAQGSYFRSAQVARFGFSAQLLRAHVLSGRLVRLRRGIYRVAHLPAPAQSDLIELWLWSGERAVFSHETALAMYGISDALPSRIHMTVPRAWERRRLAVPRLAVLHHADLPDSDRTWIDFVPVTTPARTLRDIVDAGVDPQIIDQAIADGLAKKLFGRADLRGIVPHPRSPSARRRALETEP
jgi:predicted transcriptional regulator of viral defense system